MYRLFGPIPCIESDTLRNTIKAGAVSAAVATGAALGAASLAVVKATSGDQLDNFWSDKLTYGVMAGGAAIFGFVALCACAKVSAPSADMAQAEIDEHNPLIPGNQA